MHCQTCGACCANFRVSFYWGETDAAPQGSVPTTLTIPISPHYVAMRGSTSKPCRCIALGGQVGESVSCSIYTNRSSTCREVVAGDEQCNKARVAHGMEKIAEALII
ncbi:YkgJ family cysteine cluster protein [Iodobacter sp.]|uniref:YkgJ family cysteine cluster protein n=1 Tax=Iodobacter sp. TaxID=1915058 RepID=UPI0025DC70AF|nr:YkgJ family cysteine cluster protein [Iodobacter sp.]